MLISLTSNACTDLITLEFGHVIQAAMPRWSGLKLDRMVCLF